MRHRLLCAPQSVYCLSKYGKQDQALSGECPWPLFQHATYLNIPTLQYGYYAWLQCWQSVCVWDQLPAAGLRVAVQGPATCRDMCMNPGTATAVCTTGKRHVQTANNSATGRQATPFLAVTNSEKK